MADLIDRQAALNMRFSEGYNNDGVMFVPLREVTEWIKALPTVQSEPLTDAEQRIFLAAMGKERAVCKKLTDEWDGMKLDVPCPVNLLQLCAEIERKVKAALWTK